MECHLITLAKEGKIGPDTIRDSFEYFEDICRSSKFVVALCRCKDCGQVFIYCFKEYNTLDGEDYYWTFWLPVSQEDIDGLKKARILLKFMGELIMQRPQICWADNDKIYWKEEGLPAPLAVPLFLPF